MKPPYKVVSTALLLAPLAAVSASKGQPNILVILTDDVGWGDFQCYNPQGKISSPNVDRLAREGMRFANAHEPAALCSPSRYSMLTGNFPWRGRAAPGVWGFNELSDILPGQLTVANMLQAAGYHTAMFGKSGIGGQHADKEGHPDFTKPMIDGPKRWGFDYSFIIPRGHQSSPHLFLENELPSCGADKVTHGKERGKGGGDSNYSEPGWQNSQVGERLLDAAEKFLDDVIVKNRASENPAPFYMHFCTDGAHAPYDPPDQIRGTPVKGQTKISKHTDMVLETDVLLGKLMGIFEKRGLLDNTLICFTSDNGGIPSEQYLGHDAVGGLRGLKGFLPEGGHRVPFLIRWPGKVPSGAVRDQFVSTFDIVPTALELAGVKIPAGQCLDAVSLVPVLTGLRCDSNPVRSSMLVQSSPGRDVDDDGGIKGGSLTGKEQKPDMLALHGKEEGAAGKIIKSAKKKMKNEGSSSDGMGHAVYSGDWKLMINIADQPAALYNLKDDLTESNNQISSQPERVQAMEKIYREIRASQSSSALTRNNP